MKKGISVIGVGNIFRKDDAIGIHVVEYLEKKNTFANVRFICKNISGLDVIKYFDYEFIIIIDAVKMNKKPGTIKVFNPKNVNFINADSGVTTHGLALHETLKIAFEINHEYNIMVVGIEPSNTEFGLNLTNLIKQKIPNMVKKVELLISNFQKK
ncbi:MAG: hydrogenase maturation protease [bacterium]